MLRNRHRRAGSRRISHRLLCQAITDRREGVRRHGHGRAGPVSGTA
jgi:hypothetical protein